MRLALAFALAACNTVPTPPSAAPHAPSAVGLYRTTSGCQTGSPENPTCTSMLTLNADGKGEFIGDDIVEPISWLEDADRVVVKFPDHAFQLHVNEDGNLVEAGGTLWTRE